MQKLEHEILDILCEDARTAPEKIAEMVGESAAAVQACIDKLEQDGVIIRYRALIDWERVDREIVQAWIEVRVTPQSERGFDSIAEKIYRYPEVKAMYLMSGPYDFMVRVEGNSLKSVAMFVSQKLSVIDGVQSTATHFMLKRYKSDGVILDGQSSDRRLAVSP
ncbi:MAG: Lrp/AsnC family transcriptional regulator [Christensenellales bacterium]